MPFLTGVSGGTLLDCTATSLLQGHDSLTLQTPVVPEHGGHAPRATLTLLLHGHFALL